jgi:hypothetical protein
MGRLQVMQFYAMFKNALLAQRYHHAFYMEPDTWPVREQHDTTDNLPRVPDDVQCSTAQHSTGVEPSRAEPARRQVRKGWLEAVLQDALEGDFWMKGSAMRNPPRFNIG